MPTVKEEDDGWDKVAHRLQLEIDARGVSLSAVERASGVSYKTIRKLLDGGAVTRRDRLAPLADYFGWTTSAFDDIRQGHEPKAVAVPGTKVVTWANLDEFADASAEDIKELLAIWRVMKARDGK